MDTVGGLQAVRKIRGGCFGISDNLYRLLGFLPALQVIRPEAAFSLYGASAVPRAVAWKTLACAAGDGANISPPSHELSGEAPFDGRRHERDDVSAHSLLKVGTAVYLRPPE